MPGNPHLRLFAGAVMISFSAVFVKVVGVAPATSAFYRALIGGIALTAFLALGRKLPVVPRRAWPALFMAAFFFALDIWVWHRSIVYVGPGLATLLGNFQVFIMMGAGALFLGQRIGRRQLISVLLALAGLAMIVGLDWQALPGDYRLGVVFGLLTAFFYAGYLLLMRQARLGSAHEMPTREMAVMSLLVALMLGPAALIEGASLAIPTAADGAWLVLYGLLGNFAGMTLIASSLTRVSAAEVGLALLLQPALSFVWDVLFFGRELQPLEMTGAVVALIAIYLGAARSSQQA